MTLFLIVSVLVPIFVFLCLPRFLEYIKSSGTHNTYILLLACILFFVSWYLPSPEIQGQQTQATTHFIGGGIFTALLWIYSKQYFGWNSRWIIELISLLALVSLLGVANELFELFVVNIGLASLRLTDTSWDLLMNTAGAIFIWTGYFIYRQFYHRVPSNDGS